MTIPGHRFYRRHGPEIATTDNPPSVAVLPCCHPNTNHTTHPPHTPHKNHITKT